MKLILLRNFLLLLLLCVPPQSYAQLSSESYQVIGHAVGGAQTSFVSTSTSYSLVQESGGLYIYSTTSESSSEPSTGGTGTLLEDSIVVDEPISVSIYTQSTTFEQGALVAIVLNLQTAKTEIGVLGADPQIVVSGANNYLLDTNEIGGGVYTVDYVGVNAGQDYVSARIAGISTGNSLTIRVIAAPASVSLDPMDGDSERQSDNISDSTPGTYPVEPENLQIDNSNEQAVSQASNKEDAAVSDVLPNEILKNLEISTFFIPVSLKWSMEQIAIIGLGIGILTSVLNFLRIPFSVGRLFATNAHNFFALLVFWKRKRPWGTVYDSATKAPVDPAYVELFDVHGVKKAESITDLDGRYGFVVPEGLYTMNVRKVNYQFPSKKSLIKKRDVLYNNLYFGGEVSITDAVTHDIPLDPVSFDWNQQEKMRTNQTYFIRRFDHFLVLVLDIVFYIGAGAVMWQFKTHPDVYTGSIVALYVLLLVLRYKRGGMVLYGVVKKSGTTLPYAVVRVLRNNKEILSRITDIHGRYVAIVPVGTYMVRIEELVNPDEYRTVYEKKIYAKHGVINSNIKI